MLSQHTTQLSRYFHPQNNETSVAKKRSHYSTYHDWYEINKGIWGYDCDYLALRHLFE